MIYLYAITAKLAGPQETVCGLDHEPLVYLEASGLSAVVSRVGVSAVVPTPQRLWQHEQVVEALMTRTSVIPVRFNTLFQDEAAVSCLLAESHEAFEEELGRVRGCVELGLRVLRMAETADTPEERKGLPCPDLLTTEMNGRAFKVARRAAGMQRETSRRRDEILAEMLNRSLVELSVDHLVSVRQRPGILMKAAYLVEQEQLPQIREAVHRLVKMHKNLHFLCTGPWPPYHFVRPIEASPVG